MKQGLDETKTVVNLVSHVLPNRRGLPYTTCSEPLYLNISSESSWNTYILMLEQNGQRKACFK